MKYFIIPGVLLLFISTANLTAQWVQSSTGMNSGSVTSLLVNGNYIFAGTGAGVYVSSNTGTSWTQTSLNNRSIHSLTSNSNFIFASTINYGVYRSSDNGITWSQTSLNGGSIQLLKASGNTVLAANHVFVFKSTDNGTSWQVIFTSQNPDISSLASNVSTLFIGEHGVFLSTNSGLNWFQTLNTNALMVTALASNSNNVFAGSLGVFRSTDNGLAWSQASLNNVYISALFIYDNNIFAGTSDYGVYVSNNNGASWVQRSEGLNSSPSVIEDFCILNNYIFAGTWQHNIYKRQLNELVGINPVSGEVPVEFALYQNYPNPFNPTTHLRFEIPKGRSELRLVKLAIYDVLGREVTTLVNEQLPPGTYEVEWDATDYPSGVYYYKLIAGVYSDSKKMVFVK